MDYEDYTADSTRVVKSGRAYRLLGHDCATYYQYAIYVSRPTYPRPPPSPPSRLPPRTPTAISSSSFFLCPRQKKIQENIINWSTVL